MEACSKEDGTCLIYSDRHLVNEGMSSGGSEISLPRTPSEAEVESEDDSDANPVIWDGPLCVTVLERVQWEELVGADDPSVFKSSNDCRRTYESDSALRRQIHLLRHHSQPLTACMHHAGMQGGLQRR